MNIATFLEQYASGSNAPAGVAMNANARLFNTTDVNNIQGCVLDVTDNPGQITLSSGNYLIEASAESSKYGQSQLILFDVVNNVVLAAGKSKSAPIFGPFAQDNLGVTVKKYIEVADTLTFAVLHYVGMGTADACLGVCAIAQQVALFAQATTPILVPEVFAEITIIED
jgi:hypothetical protein